jgi:hypothetical protein
VRKVVVGRYLHGLWPKLSRVLTTREHVEIFIAALTNIAEKVGTYLLNSPKRLHELKSVLSRPGRGGAWFSFLKEQSIPRTTADRLVNTYEKAISGAAGKVVRSNRRIIEFTGVGRPVSRPRLIELKTVLARPGIAADHWRNRSRHF